MNKSERICAAEEWMNRLPEEARGNLIAHDMKEKFDLTDKDVEQTKNFTQ